MEQHSNYHIRGNQQASQLTVPLDMLSRLSILEAKITQTAALGYSVVSKNKDLVSCTMVKPAEQTNHVLHLLMTLFTCGFWVIVWFILAASDAKAITVNIFVDNCGNVIVA